MTAMAVDGLRRLTRPYEYGMNDHHLPAAQALASKLGYDSTTIEYVGTHNGPGNVYRARR